MCWLITEDVWNSVLVIFQLSSPFPFLLTRNFVFFFFGLCLDRLITNIFHRAVAARSDSREVVTPARRSREDGVTRKEITASPYKDGYVWRKYGQKNIQNCNFVR
jgi:hypothetical protein